MITDSIVKEIRKYRKQHTEKYKHDLNKICNALNKREKNSNKKMLVLIQDYHQKLGNNKFTNKKITKRKNEYIIN